MKYILPLFICGFLLSQEDKEVTKSPEIIESVISLDIKDREPIHPDSVFPDTVGSLVCFTAVKADTPTRIIHRWIYKDKEMASIYLQIEEPSPRYRVWSRKRIMSLWRGQWKVEVLNAEGELIDSLKFRIKPLIEEKEE